MTRPGVTIRGYLHFMTGKTNAIVAVHCSAFVVLAGVGALGLSFDSRPARESFAVLLFALVAARCAWGMKSLPLRSLDAKRGFDRSSVRIVYLLLYSLLGFQLMLDLSAGTALHTEHCQIYVACGILAVLLIRALSELE